VDLALELLTQHQQTQAIVAASGDIGCLGACTIAIQDPFTPQGEIATMASTLPRLAVSTSGNYERYIKTKAHNHLIDPKTLKPQQWFASVTLIDTDDNTRLDALATAVSVMEESKAVSLLHSLSIAYVLIRNDGTLIMSPMPTGITLRTHP
jgi:thiamine biosynthesis lipoprotein